MYKIEAIIKIFDKPLILAESVAAEFMNICDKVISEKDKINIALSGGSTPKVLFEVLADKYKNRINWQRVNFYWVDERCVAPDSEESNFGMTVKYLLSKVEIPDMNVHRIFGENDPEKEAIRYSEILEKNIESKRNLPAFDLILLGMGEDGHTASIFPDQLDLLHSNKFCAVAIHPESGQKRITLTGNVINNADRIYFLVTGSNKSKMIEKILEKKEDYLKFPAAHIYNGDGILEWNLEKN